MSDTEDPERPSKRASKTGKPLPRLWKSEPDSSAEPVDPAADAHAKSSKDKKKDSSQGATKSKSSSGKTAKSKTGKGASGPGGKNGKTVLVEETPALDTYESRRKVRVLMGSLTLVCALLVFWIVYRVFLHESSDVVVANDQPAPAFGSPEPRPPLDNEARFMLNRAKEDAKSGRVDHAVTMLKQVASVYRGTPAAAEAKEALDRPGHNLPLFPDGPAIVAEHQHIEPAGPVAATPSAGAGATPAGPQPGPDPAQPAAPEPPPGPGHATLVLPESAGKPGSTAPGAQGPEIARATITPSSLAPRTLPPGFSPKLEAGLHESGWPRVIVGQRDGGAMVLVPGGTFTMGGDGRESPDSPAHSVRVSMFYIDQHEVTTGQLRMFLEERRRGQLPGQETDDEKMLGQSDSAPAVYVDYKDAEAFALWSGKRLPTEAQWELAARSTDGRRFPWGDHPIQWSRPRAFRQIDPVMSFPEDVSPYGAFDMAGNCAEWVRDWYDPHYFEKLKDKTVENPSGPATKGPRSIQRTVKGGSRNWTASFREGKELDKRLPYLGFRCSLAVEGPEAAAIITPRSTKPTGPKSGTNAPPGANPSGDVPF
jgi:formylglycine-generating enzyme required for sulfatase activity